MIVVRLFHSQSRGFMQVLGTRSSVGRSARRLRPAAAGSAPLARLAATRMPCQFRAHAKRSSSPSLSLLTHILPYVSQILLTFSALILCVGGILHTVAMNIHTASPAVLMAQQAPFLNLHDMLQLTHSSHLFFSFEKIAPLISCLSRK